MEARKDDSNELEMTRMDDSTADAGLAVEPAPEEMDRRPRVPARQGHCRRRCSDSNSGWDRRPGTVTVRASALVFKFSAESEC